MSEATAALAYANRGWYVGPVRRGTKHPGSVLGDDWNVKTSRDPQIIANWFAGTDHGVFLHCGRSGAWVADVDTPENLHPAIQTAINECNPPYQSTRSNVPGRGHYVFLQPEGRRLGNGLGKLAKGWGEGRGLNGVIIVAPSEHQEKDGRYEWLEMGPVPVMPGYLATQLPDVLEAAEAATDAQVAAFLSDHHGDERPELLTVHLAAWQKKLAAGESRHNSVLGHISGAMKEAKAGFIDANAAAVAFQSIFEPAVMQQPIGPKQGKARSQAEAENEWRGILAWAVAQGSAADPAETRARIERMSADPFSGLYNGQQPSTNGSTAPSQPPPQPPPDPSQGQPQQAAGRTLQVTRASHIAMRATRWLWEDEYGKWIPEGALVGMGGREGVGKSTVCADIAALVTQGELRGDLYGKGPKGVIIVSTEDDWHATIKPRLVGADADLDYVFQVRAVEPDGLEGTLSLPEDLKQLEDIIRQHDVALIILDPLLTMVNAKLDTHKDAEVRRALEPIVSLAHATKTSLVGLVHVNKSNEGDLLNRIMASRALTGVPRGFLFCARYAPAKADEDNQPSAAEALSGRPDEFILGQIKNNLAAKVNVSRRYHMETEVVGFDADANKDIEASYIVYDEVIIANIEDVVLEQERAKKAVKTQRAKAEVWLVGFLAGKGEVPSRFVVKAGKEAGYSRDAIHRARRELEDRIEVISLPVIPRQTAWKLLPQ
jgi:AAA domain/Bifunctional DNA primase/polymerase, N-terminal